MTQIDTGTKDTIFKKFREWDTKIAGLEDKLNRLIRRSPIEVTSLPAVGDVTDGTEIYFVPTGLTPGLAAVTPLPRWHMRYSSSDNKWIRVGGGFLALRPAATGNMTLGSAWQDFPGTSKPEFILPRGGRWRIEADAAFSPTGSMVPQIFAELLDLANTYQAQSWPVVQPYTPVNATTRYSAGVDADISPITAAQRKLRWMLSAPNVAGTVNTTAVLRVRPIYLDPS